MSARQSPVERDARKLAARDLRISRQYRGDSSALELLDASAGDLAREAARAVLRGDMPEARRYARAHQLVAQSRGRLSARRTRDRDAELEREAAQHGIKTGDVVRVLRAGIGTQAPAGTEVTIEDVRGVILHTTIDGVVRIVWAKDVERVEPDPIPESRILTAGNDVVRTEWFECDRPGCGAVIGDVGGPDDEWDDYDPIGEHIAGHERDDAAVPA